MADVVAYRSYLICKNPWTGLTWVEKGGCRICYAASFEEAKRQIDMLVNA